MTGSAPVCDCPESRVCYAEGYDQSEAFVSSPGEAETIPPEKLRTPASMLDVRRRRISCTHTLTNQVILVSTCSIDESVGDGPTLTLPSFASGISPDESGRNSCTLL